ncbi:MAG TPA: flagellar basal-body rod protein FlgF [Bdellovibrionales bacterium]|nr:flagellar basal-body rod protein FlgF [Pseudobdellovibrionaceae bacterium]HAG92431.1 flagellar basal-body rod protein FlgF [Bdellovibrionales bacterium]
MSSKGIYTAVSGAIAQSSRLDTIANNIANSNSTGFKKDRQVFSEYLSSYEKEQQLMKVPRVPASVESFYDMQGGDKAYVNPAGTYTDHSQGLMKSTGRNLDFGIEGKGFFEVLTPQGVRWTRNGSFTINGEGQLVTHAGYPVLVQGNQPPEQRVVQVGNQKMTVSKQSDIYIGGAPVGRLALMDFPDPTQIRKEGAGLFQRNSEEVLPVPVNDSVRVHQGFVEGSNVNVVEEMTDMIMAQRVFEATQQAIKAFDHMDDKLINGVGR